MNTLFLSRTNFWWTIFFYIVSTRFWQVTGSSSLRRGWRLGEDLEWWPGRSQPGLARTQRRPHSSFLKIPEAALGKPDLSLFDAREAQKQKSDALWYNEFKVNTEGQKVTFQKKPEKDAWSPGPVRSRPRFLPSLEIETDLYHEL